MGLKSFIKLEISGWTKPEIIGLISVIGLILINAQIIHDSPIAVISSICGILYTIIAGKGKISCYFFGLIGSGLYCYLSFKNSLWGNLFLYLLYYIPMEILGIFQWKKHLKKTNNEIYKTSLDNNQRLKLVFFSILLSIVFIIILSIFNDSNPLLDGVTTALSILGMYLTVKRCIEQWIIWIIVNALSVIIWIYVILNGQRAYSTAIMWFVFFILAIYFYFKWINELKYQKIHP